MWSLCDVWRNITEFMTITDLRASNFRYLPFWWGIWWHWTHDVTYTLASQSLRFGNLRHFFLKKMNEGKILKTSSKIWDLAMQNLDLKLTRLQWNIGHLKADPGFNSIMLQVSQSPSLHSVFIRALIIKLSSLITTIMQTN